jgi:hypothetical protein
MTTERGRTLSACAAVAALGLLAACGSADQPEVDPLHLGEETFVGTVTGHDKYDLNKLEVDQAKVSLNLIGPVDGRCSNAEESLRDQAEAAKQKLLAVGTRVLVVRAADNGDWAFVHLLPSGEDEPDPPAPAASVNEQLVSGGYWEPSGYELEDDDSETTAEFAIRYPQSLSPVQGQYAPLIVAAANTAEAARTTGYGACAAEEEELDAQERAWREEAERQAEENERRRRENENSDGYCRDGDGDGVCHED